MATKHPGFLPKKPQGVITRGKTAQNRLRQTDHFLMIYDPQLLGAGDDSIFVDLGYGFGPMTTLELADRFHLINPTLKLVGVEIDPDRVSVALPYRSETVDFRLGGFNIPVRTGEYIRGIRAFNVLRQYTEEEVEPSWTALSRNVVEGGVLLEGTSNPNGSIWVSNLLRMREGHWKQEALVFYSNLKGGFDPANFQPVLPKNYIHHMVEGEWIHSFFEDWKQAARDERHQQVWGNGRWFTETANKMASRGYCVNTRRRFLSRGFFVLKNLPVKG